MAHHIYQQVEVLLGTNLSDCKKERTSVSKGRLFCRLRRYILYPIIDDSYGFPLHVEQLLHLSAHKLRDTCHSIGLIDGMLQKDSVLQLTNPVLLCHEIEIVDRKHKFLVFSTFPLDLLLIGRMPQINSWQSFTEMPVILFTDIGGLNRRTAICFVSFGQEEMEC